MYQSKALTYKFNLSLGFAPVVLTLVLSWFTNPATAAGIGAMAGVLWCALHSRKGLSHFILYGITSVLLLLAALCLLAGSWCPHYLFPLLAEAAVLVPLLILLFNRKRLTRHNRQMQYKQGKKVHFMQGMEASIVSARLAVITGCLHLLLLLLVLALDSPLSDTARFVWFEAAPPGVFLFAIFINQLGIVYFNRLMNRLVFVPVITEKGEVTGKETLQEAAVPGNCHLHPIVRIAVISQGMLYLLPRTKASLPEKGKTDLLMEDYVLYGESVSQCAKRMVRDTCPAVELDRLHFNLTYHYEQQSVNRLVYLFTADLGNDDSPLCCSCIKNGKLWTLGQIEANLNKNFFSSYLEYEYEYLKDIICTREIYKES